tara:strand:- start:46 stop:1932 length:1887 start_codon:yes stop_codon:yes gene_type:complete
MKKNKVDHTNLAVVLSLILFLYTLIAVGISEDWSTRNIYNLIYLLFLNFTVLTFNAILFSKKRKYLNESLRKYIRIAVIVSYSTTYIFLVTSFISTGQIARVQTILFLSNMHPLWIAGVIALAGTIFFLIFVGILSKKTPLVDLRSKNRKKLKIIFIINLILLIITIGVNFVFLEIENKIITDESELISYQFEKQILQEKLAEINPDKDKPNVVFILLETLSAERLGTHGYERNVSPNIDKLASKSIVFENAFSTSSHSDYAQPGLLSSRYIFSSEYRNLFSDNNPRKFVWDIFKEDNYTTGYFSSQDDRWQGMNYYLNYTNLDNFSYSMTDGKTDYGSGYAKKDMDHKTSALALTWLNETIKKDDPFFLYLNFQATHNPMVYPKNYSIYKPDESINPLSTRGPWVTNRYDNALGYVDDQVGKILNFLEENNLSNSTVITITSDHGHDLENRHNVFGHGKSIYNEELIVPEIMFFPGVEPQRINDRVSHIDFVPTLLDALGYKLPYEFQGEVMRENKPIFFVAQSHFYLIGMIQDNIKIIIDVNNKLVEVYDLENDPEELIKLNSKDHNDKILKLLFWHYCQKDYYEKDRWEAPQSNRCFLHNNFKNPWDAPEESILLSPWKFFRDKF